MTRSILLVEDEENDVFFLTKAARLAGIEHPLRVARDGEQAIAYFEGRGPFTNRDENPLPYLVLLDLKLPYMRGLEVLKWLREKLDTRIIILVLSSSMEERDMDEAYRLGANGYLVKPTDFGMLVELVKSIDDFWLKYNHPNTDPALSVSSN